MPIAASQANPVKSTAPFHDLDAPHSMEREVHRRLQGEAGLEIKSLVVRRTPAGVCLEGRIETQDRDVDLRQLMAGIPGLSEVINHLVICCPWPRQDEETV